MTSPDSSDAAQHRLEHQHVADHVLVQDVEREQRMAQVIEHAHEQHQVEALAEGRQLVDRHLPELDVGVQHLRREPGLGEVARIGVDASTWRAPRRFISIA